MHLARLHQKHSSLAAAAAANSVTQSAEAAASDASVSSASSAAATARPNNAPLTGTNLLAAGRLFHVNLGDLVVVLLLRCDWCRICVAGFSSYCQW